MSHWSSIFNLIFSAIVAVVVSGIMLFRYDSHRELGRNSEDSKTGEEEDWEDKTQKIETGDMPGYKTLYSPWFIVFFPLALLGLGVIAKLIGLVDDGIIAYVGLPIFNIFFTVTVYFLALVLLMRFLRRWLEAKTLVILWMLPGVLYIRMLMVNSIATLPVKVIWVPAKAFAIMGVVWAVGAAAVFGWNVIRHLQFKKEIFQGARAVPDEDEGEDDGCRGDAGRMDFSEMKERIRIVWAQELQRMPEKISTEHLEIYVSPNAKTPVSVGVSQEKMKIVLPERDYTEEELRWILRHELRHIANDDCSNKLFMIFCKSIGWFLPQMWLAARYAAEDIELGCDESVLKHASADSRRFYAGLLLQTAGDGRGFTTCLSASGISMRYRLKHVVVPQKVHPVLNILAVGIISFLLMFTYGMVGITAEKDTCANIFAGGNLGDYKITAYEYKNEDYDHKILIDTETAKTYLNQTEISELYGSSFDVSGDDDREWYITLEGPEYYELEITDQCIVCYDAEDDTEYYYVN